MKLLALLVAFSVLAIVLVEIAVASTPTTPTEEVHVLIPATGSVVVLHVDVETARLIQRAAQRQADTAAKEAARARILEALRRHDQVMATQKH